MLGPAQDLADRRRGPHQLAQARRHLRRPSARGPSSKRALRGRPERQLPLIVAPALGRHPATSGPAARTPPGSSPPRPPGPAASAGAARDRTAPGAARTRGLPAASPPPPGRRGAPLGRPQAVDPMSRTCETTCSVPESGVEIRTIDCASPASSTCRTRNASPSGVPAPPAARAPGTSRPGPRPSAPAASRCTDPPGQADAPGTSRRTR